MHPKTTPSHSPLAASAATLWLAALLLLPACGPSRYALAQTVTDAGDGHFWLAGSEGLAAYYDGHRMERRPYPKNRLAPGWAYEYSSMQPSAHVVLQPDKAPPCLITHVGDVMLWSQGHEEWQPVDAIFNPDKRFHQLNRVLVAPDGQLVVQLHPTRLVWVYLEELLAGKVGHQEDTPSYFNWLGFIEGRLYGFGWDDSGEIRAIHRRGERGGWEMLARLPNKRQIHDGGVVRMPDGTLGAVHLGGLLRTSARADAGAVTDPPTTDPVMFDVVKDGLGCVRDFSVVPRRGTWLFGCYGVTELGPQQPTHWKCPTDQMDPTIGAVPIPGGVRLVTQHGAVWDLVDGRCVRALGRSFELD